MSSPIDTRTSEHAPRHPRVEDGGRARSPAPWAPVLAMQRAAGNRAVARVLAEQRGECRSAASGSGPKLQRQLVSETDGRIRDTRDSTQPRLVFEPLGDNSYRVLGAVVTYYASTDQFAVGNGWYFDPYSRQSYQYSNDYGLYACGGQWYWYDGAYYRPYVQQQTTTTPQTSSPSSQSTGQTSVPTSSSSSAPSQSSGKMSNADFSNLIRTLSTQTSLSSQLASQTTLSGCVQLLRGWSNRQEALALVRSSGHARGFKGLLQRIEDRRTYTKIDRGHRYAEYQTYWLYAELLQALKISIDTDDLAKTCRSYRFDKDPDTDPSDDGGGGLGSATRGQKQRLGMI